MPHLLSTDVFSYNDLIQEKNSLQKAYNLLVNKTKVSSVEVKDVKLLKKIIQNLEYDTLKQKNKYQRQLSKKSFECKKLEARIKEMAAKERNLQLKVKSLTSELNFYKRYNSSSFRRPSSSTNTRSSIKSKRSLSRERSFHTNLSSKEYDRSSSIEKLKISSVRQASKRSSSRNSRGSINSSIQRRKSVSSNSGKPPVYERTSSFNNRATSRTPSSKNFRRFNPTKYNEEKKKKLKQSQQKRLRDISSKFLNSSSDNIRGRSKTRRNCSDKKLSIENRRSAHLRIDNRVSPSLYSHSCDNSSGGYTRENSSNEINMISRSPALKTKNSLQLKNSGKFDEIDLRLNALQQYMLEIEKN